MHKAFGIINPSKRNVFVDGMQNYRPIGAFSFLGRYRVIDFPISNFSNSGIDRIQVYIDSMPRSIIEHIGRGRHYNINSKSGRMQMLFSAHSNPSSIYNTDISWYVENMEHIQKMHNEYVIIAPSYMVFSADYAEILKAHAESGADITLLYHAVDNAKEAYLTCDTLNLNRQKGVLSIEPNNGTVDSKNIFMDTYIMKKDLFVELIYKAQKLSSMYTLSDIVNLSCDDLDIRGIAHTGYFASITDFKSYYKANMELIDYKAAKDLFHEEWPIYTRTNDSCPTRYFDTSNVKSSVISNGCMIEGTVENSIIGRGCHIQKGAVVKNSIVLADVVISEGVVIENQVVDKQAKVVNAKEIISAPEDPGYVRRNDTL